MAVNLTSVRRSGYLALAGLAGSVLASSGAFAQVTTTFQNCTTTQVPTPITITNIGTLAIPASAASSAISAAIGNVSTAFLTQQGSAFVSAPADPSSARIGGGPNSPRARVVVPQPRPPGPGAESLPDPAARPGNRARPRH